MNTEAVKTTLKRIKKAALISCLALFFKNIKKLSVFCIGFLLIISSPANAVLLTFNELDQSDYFDENGDLTPLSNEYEAQGLVFRSLAYLVGGEGSNAIAGPGFGFEFVGDNLPIFVSFNLGSPSGIAVDITVRGPNYFKSVISSGEIVGMTDDPGTPYIPNELFSFSSLTGISSVYFSGKAGNDMDNLTYTYANDVAVPEPLGILLFGVGLLGLISSRHIGKSRK